LELAMGLEPATG